MTSPMFVTGGNADRVVTEDFDYAVNKESLGVFAQQPGATKKYIRNDGPRDGEYRETMARMFIEMSARERPLFIASLPPETQELAKVLVGVGTAASGGTGFIDFLLTNVQEQFSEKVQVLESLSDNFVVYTFGQAAPQFQYSGLLLNTWQDDQRVWMTRLYQDVLRGTQLARRRKLLRLRYDSVIVSGVVTNLNMSLTADQEDRSPFSFGFIPLQYVIYTPSIGVPTKLEEPFLPSASFAIAAAAVPSNTRVRVAARPPTPAQATKVRQIEKNPSMQIKPKLDGDATKKPSPAANVRGGVLSGSPLFSGLVSE